jgi:indolepyruvate ferredoxin oxidoreductase beta subunit
VTQRANVVLVGVTGQPVLATARFLCEAALHANLDASCSESPSAAAGAGALLVHARIGEAIHSPVIGDGEADILVAFEQVEALRAAHLLRPGGFAAVNERLIRTWRMRAGLEAAPASATSRLHAVTERVVGVRAESLVRRVDAASLIGFALLGVVSPLLPVPWVAFDAAIEAMGGRGIDARRQALARGRKLFEALPARLAAGAAPARADQAERTGA